MPPRASRLAPAALLAVLAAALGPARAAGESVRFGRSDACDAPFAREPASADALQRTAFEWTHEAPLKNWEYAVVNIAESGMRDNEWYDWELEAHCGRVTYSSAVRMPAVLQKYTSLGNFRTTIIKVTCVQAGWVVLNDVRLSDIPFIRRVHITSRLRFADGLAETLAHAQFDLPWYLRFLRSTATDIVTRSYTEEVRATVHQLCAARG